MAFYEKPADFSGKAFEMVVGLGEVANVVSAPDSYNKDTISGYKIWDKDGSGKWENPRHFFKRDLRNFNPV